MTQTFSTQPGWPTDLLDGVLPSRDAAPSGLFGALVDASREGDKSAYSFLGPGGEAEADLTFRAVLESSLRVSHRLRSHGVREGDRALILHRPGLDYVSAFFGCIAAGIIAVPLYPVRARNAELIKAIAMDCRPVIALSDDRNTASNIHGMSLPVVTTADWRSADFASMRPTPGSEGLRLAYLQYTAGHAGRIDVVPVDHRTALARCLRLAESWQIDPESVIVSWLPMSLEFALLSSVLMPVVCRCRVIAMAPSTFVREPVRWLEAVSRFRGTHSGATNSAYHHCVESIDQNAREGLDLSSWRQVDIGPESITDETVDRFRDAFADCGLGSPLTPQDR